MADLRTLAALVAVALATSGCGLDALEGKKSDFQIEMERQQELAMPEPAAVVQQIVEPVAEIAAVVPDVAPVVAEPVIAPEPEPPAPIVLAPVIPPPPPCAPIFRVLMCDEDGREVWL